MLSTVFNAAALLLLAHVLLLAKGESSTNAGSSACAPRTALTCHGAGYRSMASCSGLAAGFLTFAADEEVGGLGGLLGNIDVVAGNSGGAWWTTNTLYSTEIPEMQEEMAASPSEAGTIYNSKFTLKTVGLRRRLNSPLPELSPALCPIYAAGYEQLSPGVPQVDIIFNSFIGGVSSIQRNATLSAEPNGWAKGKILLVGASLPTPGLQSPGGGRVWVHFTSEQMAGVNGSITSEFNGSISYRARSEDSATLPRWTPVKFSFRLGDGPGAEAPAPFCADASCHGLYFEWDGTIPSGGGPTTSHVSSSPPMGEVFASAFVEGAGSLPIAQVVMASNTPLASAVVTESDEEAMPNGEYPILADEVAACVDLSTWADIDSWGNPFLPEDNQITPGIINQTAASGLHALADGAWTDNTVVASAIAVLTADAKGCSSEPRSLSVTTWVSGPDVPFGLTALFPGADLTLGPVCSSPTLAEVLDALGSGGSYVEPPFDAVHLTRINYGTINCETADNPWYGVKAGFMVDIHFVWVVTPLDIAVTAEDFFAHGVLAGEIVRTVAHHNETLMDVARLIFPKDEADDSDADSATSFVFPALPLLLSFLLPRFLG